MGGVCGTRGHSTPVKKTNTLCLPCPAAPALLPPVPVDTPPPPSRVGMQAPRKLEWRPSLGTVQLELCIGGQELELSVRLPPCACCSVHAPAQGLGTLFPPPPNQVSPVHAAIILQFRSRASWPVAELAAALGLAPEALRRKAVYWVNQGRQWGRDGPRDVGEDPLAVTAAPERRAIAEMIRCRSSLM